MDKSCVMFDKVWSDEVLDYYREKCKNWQGKQVEEGKLLGDREVYFINEDYPDPSILISQYLEFLPPLINDMLLGEVTKGFSIDAKLSRYAISQNYNWHCDEKHAYRDNPEWSRVVSSITYLNDDYEGGQTEFEDLIIEPKSGNTLVFPSGFTFPHRGLPVTSGVKYILVMHFWT